MQWAKVSLFLMIQVLLRNRSLLDWLSMDTSGNVVEDALRTSAAASAASAAVIQCRDFWQSVKPDGLV